MSSLNELKSAASEAVEAVRSIVPTAERFVKDEIYGGAFVRNGWNDTCGTKIGTSIVETVSDAVQSRLNPFDIEKQLTGACDELKDVFNLIATAQKEFR